MAAPHHAGGDLRALLRHLVLQRPFLIADRPQDDRGRIAIALDHRFQLRHAFRAWNSSGASRTSSSCPCGRMPPPTPASACCARCAPRCRPSAQHRQAKRLQAVGQRRADAGMVLMVACALDLHRLAIEEKPLSASNTAVRTPKVTRLAHRALCSRSQPSPKRCKDSALQWTRARMRQRCAGRKSCERRWSDRFARRLWRWPRSCPPHRGSSILSRLRPDCLRSRRPSQARASQHLPRVAHIAVPFAQVHGSVLVSHTWR